MTIIPIAVPLFALSQPLADENARPQLSIVYGVDHDEQRLMHDRERDDDVSVYYCPTLALGQRATLCGQRVHASHATALHELEALHYQARRAAAELRGESLPPFTRRGGALDGELIEAVASKPVNIYAKGRV